MNSRIFQGGVMHERLGPIGHAFSYPLYFYCFDLEELPELSEKLWFFGYNRLAIASLHDQDYLTRGEGSIRSKVMKFLAERDLAKGVDRIELVTSARYFNYVFNPVSFYYCYGSNEDLVCAIAEVNNTFGEKHLYLLDDPKDSKAGFKEHYLVDKDFHVSPFNDMKGQYDFYFSDIRENLDIHINILREGREVFHSRMWGKAMPMTSENFVGTVLKFPLTAALSMPRILWQAGKLYLKGLKVFTKPHPRSEMTIRVKAPTLWQKTAMKGVFNWLSGMKVGCLNLVLPDQTSKLFGDPQSTDDLKITLRVKTYDFFWKVIQGGDIAFGEAYTAGDWETDNLTGLIKLLIENQQEIIDRNPWTTQVRLFFDRLAHLARHNSITGSRQNIKAHYDLSNDFFQTFLDESMTYSCAIFDKHATTLEAAQKKKIHTVIEKAQLKKEHHLLEIGSGWGALSIEAVKLTGCRVTTVTLSDEQLKLATERVKQAGLEDRIQVLLCDYRHLTGQYDRIVSVEMIEAVGHENFGAFFNACDRLLKPNGLVVIQSITQADQRYADYLKRCDWIQKHIFPGSVIPSLGALNAAMTQHSRLVVEDVENIGIHYAKTLDEWRTRFNHNAEKIKALGFDESFQRMWNYYLCYCEAGFATRILGNLHLVLTRPNNKDLPSAELAGHWADEKPRLKIASSR
jgi:cyclopropane-fatty-acyl-phospholipid synthase